MMMLRFVWVMTLGLTLGTNAPGCNQHRGQTKVEKGMFDVKELKWKNRILVAKLNTVESAESATLRATLSQRQTEVDNRHLVLIQLCEESESLIDQQRLTVAEAQAINTHFGLKDTKKGIWLVGKDGTIKASYELPLDIDAVFALIDTMSMRKDEMKFDK